MKHTSLVTTARLTAVLALTLVSSVAFPVAAEPVIFKDADLKLGEQLMAQNKCNQCHTGRVGGDGSDIYNPKGRINEPGLLRGMVEQCNSTLNFQMFPDEVTSVAAVLNRDHYKFK